jgi:hypothetical protein
MKHLLNSMSEQEKNAIREQHAGGMKLSNEKFSKLVGSKLGEVKTLVEQKVEKKETKESFWDLNFGRPSVKDASKTQLKGMGYSYTGRDDERGGDNYIMYNGEKFFPDQIEYADYQDLGDLPRVEDGKLLIANPAWGL